MTEKLVESLLRSQWATQERDTCGTLIERLRADDSVIVVPVIDAQERPVGLIDRGAALQMVSNPLHYAVYERRSVTLLMQDEFLAVDRSDTVARISALSVGQGMATAAGGFVITSEGRYQGIGLNADLLHYLVDSNEEKARELAEINAEMMDSVRYASRIQQGMLAPLDVMSARVGSLGVIWEPRDIVGGDVYWYHETPDGQRAAYALIDCTGHGVPGSLMSMLVVTAFNRVFAESPEVGPSQALQRVGDLVRSSLNQDRADCESNDGFDCGLFVIDRRVGTFTFAGARTNCFLVPRSSEPVVRLVADRQVLGYPGTQPHRAVEEFELPLADCATAVMASDGIMDQVGDAQRIAFGPRRFAQAIERHRQMPAQEMMRALAQEVTDWRGSQHRRDDKSALAVSF